MIPRGTPAGLVPAAFGAAAASALGPGTAGVIGVGVDLVDIRRIERSIERFGARFLARIYTERERALCDARRANRLAAYARRWAAKEACAKALGTGFAQGVAARQIELDRLDGAPPFLRLHDAAAARLAALTPRSLQARLHVSLTDEPPYAVAVVVIDAAAPDLDAPEPEPETEAAAKPEPETETKSTSTAPGAGGAA